VDHFIVGLRDGMDDLVEFEVNGTSVATGFAFSPSWTQVGTFAVAARVTSVGYDATTVWTIHVVPRAWPLGATFFPEANPIVLMPGATQGFVAFVNDSASPVEIQWRLDGASVGQTSNYTFIAPAAQGDHMLSCTVTDGADVFSRSWNISVRKAPLEPGALPAHQLLVSFGPGGDIVIRLNESVTFTANVTEPALPPLTYKWQIYGGLNGTTNGGTFVVRGTVPGQYAVWVTVQNQTGIETHLWNLTVLPQGSDPSTNNPAVTNQELSTATAYAMFGLLLAAVAGAVALVFGMLYLGERRRRSEREL